MPGDPNCATCRGIGYIRRDLPLSDPNFGKLLPCPDCLGPQIARQRQADADTAAQQRLGQLLESSGLLLAHRRLTIGDVKDRGQGSRAMQAAAKDILLGNLHFATIYGPPGNGKSTLARALTMEHIRKGIPAIYARASKLFRFVQGGIGNDYTLADRYEEVLNVRFLALDELEPEEGKLNFTPFVRQHLMELIDHRYELAKFGDAITVLTMNKEPRSQLPHYICDRLEFGTADGTGFRVIYNADPSARKAGVQI